MEAFHFRIAIFLRFMAAYLSLTHTDAEATPFLLTPPDLLRGGRYLRNNMDLAVHTAIHNPLHSLSCAINDPWGLRHLHPPSRYLFENSFSNFPTLPPFFSMIAEEPRQWRGSLTSQKGALRHLPGRSLCDFFSESYSLRWQVPPQCAQSPLHLPFFLLFRTKRRARSAASAISASSR